MADRIAADRALPGAPTGTASALAPPGGSGAPIPAGAHVSAIWRFTERQAVELRGAHLGFSDGEILPLDRVAAVAAAIVEAPPPPTMLLDLILRPTAPDRRRGFDVVRLTSRSLDPARLLRRPDLGPLPAFERLVGLVRDASGAPLLTLGAPPGAPWPPRFPTIADYREMLATET